MLDWVEAAARAFEGSHAGGWATPGDLAVALDERTVQTPALRLIDAELVRAAGTPDGRLILSMPPQEGKSQRASRRFPTWVLRQRPDTRVAVASYELGVARRWGRAIRDDVTTHSTLLGLAVRPDLSAQHEWQLDGHDGGVYAAGVGGALTGRPVDLLIIDDPIKDREQAESPVYRARVWDWWTDVAATRLAPGAPVVLIMTRWHEDDLAGRLQAAEDGHLWRVVNIPAQAEHRPEHGETDPLDRQPGEYMTSARGRTAEQWDAIKVRSGSRTWAALYQGRPAPAEGGMFKRSWWREYATPPWIVEDNGARKVPGAGTLIQSWDMAFKDTKGSDYVVGQVWLRRGADALLLDQSRGRMTFTETIAAVRRLHARWPQASTILIEDKANGTAVIDSLRKSVPGIVPVTPHESKEARAAAVSPFVEAGTVHLPAPAIAPWVGDFIEEAAAFPNGSHDDQVDALSQALHRLYLGGSTVTGFLHQLAPACASCGTPVPPSEPDCPTCRVKQPLNVIEEAAS